MFRVRGAVFKPPTMLFRAICPRFPGQQILAITQAMLDFRGPGMNPPTTLFRAICPRFPGHQILAITHAMLRFSGSGNESAMNPETM